MNNPVTEPTDAEALAWVRAKLHLPADAPFRDIAAALTVALACGARVVGVHGYPEPAEPQPWMGDRGV